MVEILTATLPPSAQGSLLSRLRSLGGSVVVAKVCDELLAALLDFAKLMLEGRGRALDVEARHEVVRLVAQCGALLFHDGEDAGHGLEGEALPFGFFPRRHDSWWHLFVVVE